MKGGNHAALTCNGIGGRRIYPVHHKGISVIVHRGSSRAYLSQDEEEVHRWAKSHLRVVDLCMKHFEAAVPLVFNTILVGGDAEVRKWLRKEFSNLRRKLHVVQGRFEYGVQVFWDVQMVSRRLMKEGKLKEVDLLRKADGENSLLLTEDFRRKMERQLRQEGERLFRDVYAQITLISEAARVEPVKATMGEQMLMNFSVLLAKNKQILLGRVLAKIEKALGVRIRLTGPWPPYSFV